MGTVPIVLRIQKDSDIFQHIQQCLTMAASLDLDLDIYSADVHMDKIAEVFLFISLCNPLRWHEGKKKVHSSVQYRSRLKDSRESAAATVLFRPFQSTMVLGRNEYWNASTFGVSRWYSC